MNRVADPVLTAVRYQRDGGATSPLYKHVLQVVVDDIERGGPCADVLAHVDSALSPVADAVTLRFLGGVHRIVLDGRAPLLAQHYPSAGGRFDPDALSPELGPAFLATVADNRDELIAALEITVQTNEVGRSAALLLGYLAISAETALPLRTFEIGASAGLNMRWDHYRYEGGAHGSAWGDPNSPLCFTDRYVEPAPALDIAASVIDRRGCDARPIDATSAAGRMALRSFVWPDQVERFSLLDAALAIAEAMPVPIDQADAGDWIEDHLARPASGAATVVVHSIVWQYVPRSTRHRIVDLLEGRGAEATRDAPLAWLRMEPGEDPSNVADVRLRVWPGGDDRLLARAGYHGTPIQLMQSRG